MQCHKSMYSTPSTPLYYESKHPTIQPVSHTHYIRTPPVKCDPMIPMRECFPPINIGDKVYTLLLSACDFMGLQFTLRCCNGISFTPYINHQGNMCHPASIISCSVQFRHTCQVYAKYHRISTHEILSLIRINIVKHMLLYINQ